MSFTLKKATLALMLASVFSVSALAGNDPDYDEDFEVEEECEKPDFDRTNTKYILVTCLHNGVSVFGIKGELNNNLFGLINAKGEEVAAPEYRAIRYFSDGLLRIYKGNYKGNKEGLITTTGKIVLPTVYDDIGVLHDGYAEISIADSERNNVKKGLVNQKGEVVVQPKYYEIFSNIADSDVLVVSVKNSEEDIKYGLINLSGQIIVPIIYDEPLNSADGWARACKDKHCNFINNKGELLLPYWVNNVGSFSESMAWVKQEGRYGYIDESGQIVIPFLYDDAGFFENGRAVVSYNPANLTQELDEDEYMQRDTYGVIDMDNNIIVPFEYQRIKRVNPNLLYVQKADDFSFLDNNGNLATKKKFDKIVWGSVFDDLFSVKKDDKWGYINHDFETVIPFEYDKAVEFEHDLAAVKKNKKFGFINRDGQTVIPFDYDDPNIDINDWRTLADSKYRFDYNGVVAVYKNGYWGVIDKDNNTIVPFIYDDVIIESYSQIKATKNGVSYLFDMDGNPVEADDTESLD
ncbi:WG repeat-containing protein [Psychrobacter sp. FDAARGOS_221]|uniref:WG repeat-containing protein n=1 Tax=Psychrobacter sp. FDAARGOS_221 TaxID=1975705 RepID=UPI000BB55F86|nr:WG repeat-containing protein [Psychrobacter sp. FDAARGOS_221]PNK60466.1 hypothetical protein A6J60_005970 [Psychrobacter sp. FDAARGOS_221]